MEHMWAAPGLHYGIQIKDVHHNGPCVARQSAKKSRRSREEI